MGAGGGMMGGAGGQMGVGGVGGPKMPGKKVYVGNLSWEVGLNPKPHTLNPKP